MKFENAPEFNQPLPSFHKFLLEGDYNPAELIADDGERRTYLAKDTSPFEEKPIHIFEDGEDSIIGLVSSISKESKEVVVTPLYKITRW